MEHIRKWFYRPKRDDSSLLAQFFYADEALNVIANELDSFDGRKDPERCTALVNQLRQSQDKVLTITNAIMDALIGDERANRDFRAKFPEDVLQENLAGQLWFGAECLAAGSSIMNREFESAAMRPLAKAVTKSLENVRNLLRSTCLRNNTPNSPIKLDNNEIVTEMLLESLKIFDRLFAEFELAYVSAMVPVKSTQEYELQEMISVHFSETLQRALKMKLITQEMVDDCDPALMFTVPRLAIVSGLLSATSGPLCIDKPTSEMSEMFRPFRTLLLKIRELLWTLNRRELYMLEKLLCHNEEIDDVKSVSELDVQGDSEEFIEQFYNDYLLSRSDYISYVNSNVCDRKCKEEDQGSQASGSKEMVDKVVDFLNSQGLNLLLMSSSPSRYIVQPYMNSSEGTAPSRTDDQGIDSSSRDCDCLTAISEATTTLSSLLSDKVEASKTQPTSPDKSTLSSPNDSGISENASLDRSPSVEMEKGCCCGELREEGKGVNKKDKKPNRNVTSPSSSSDKAVPKNVLSTRKKNKYTIVNENGIEEDVLSTSSSDTSSFHSNCADDLEIAMAVQAAEMASRNEVRAKYSSSEDLIHRLFVCVAGVADQLQTNFASDLRNILKSVFLMNASDSNETTEEKIEPCPSLETSIEYRPTENEVTENNEFSVDPNILAQEALFDSNIYFRIEEENNEEESNAEGRNRVVDENGPSDPGLTPAVLEVTTTNGYTSGLERQNEPETEQPPMWIPDIEAPKCMSCGCNFTVVKRRHHCRNCGKVFCSRCSSNSVPLPKFGIVKPVRVCNKCFMYNLNPFTVRPYM